ncbi:MAG: AMP-binding protein, partial [Planctomycetota bacterium]
MRDTCVTHKSNTALIEADRFRENGRWTYQQYRTASERFAARLQSRGLDPGDRCAVLMQNQARWLI